MTISHVQTNPTNQVFQGTIEIIYPVAPTEGNLMLAGLARAGRDITVVPAGWTLLLEQGAGPIASAYWKIAGASEPTNHVWTLSAISNNHSLAIEYSNDVAGATWELDPNFAGTSGAASPMSAGAVPVDDSFEETLAWFFGVADNGDPAAAANSYITEHNGPRQVGLGIISAWREFTTGTALSSSVLSPSTSWEALHHLFNVALPPSSSAAVRRRRS